MAQIKMTCECCKEVYDLPKTAEIPAHVSEMRCNFCHKCQDKMDDYYNEWYVETPPVIFTDPNQLCLFKTTSILLKKTLIYFSKIVVN